MATKNFADTLRHVCTQARNRLLTYPQVYMPRLAGKVVQSITSSSSSHKAGTSTTSTEIAAPHNPGRYNPPANGRTSGIIAAQAAAAPLPVPASAAAEPSGSTNS